MQEGAMAVVAPEQLRRELETIKVNITAAGILIFYYIMIGVAIIIWLT